MNIGMSFARSSIDLPAEALTKRNIFAASATPV